MKSRSFAFRRAVLSLFALSVVLFNFASCKTDDDTEYVNNYIYVLPLEEDSNLIGAWTSTYEEVFTITTTSLSNTYYDDKSNKNVDAYAGDNLVVSYTNDEKTAGYIYIKYTRSINADYSFSESAPDVGKWYAVAFTELKESAVKLSAAYLEEGVTSTSTLEEAVKTFTVENGYFGTYSECSK